MIKEPRPVEDDRISESTGGIVRDGGGSSVLSGVKPFYPPSMEFRPPAAMREKLPELGGGLMGFPLAGRTVELLGGSEHRAGGPRRRRHNVRRRQGVSAAGCTQHV